MRSQPNQESICLLTTLGSEAQVITCALDLLLRQGYVPMRLVVFHTDPAFEPIGGALMRLRQSLDEHPYSGLEVVYQPIAAQSERLLEDFDTVRGAEYFLRSFYHVLWNQKRSSQPVHICASGGRKTMAMYAMSAAQLLFDENDRFWHLFSGGEFLQSKRMHPVIGDDAQLVEVPVIHWGLLSPVGSTLRQVQDPFDAIEKIRQLQLHQKWELADTFVRRKLTPAQRVVLELLAREGLSDQQIAERLVLSPRTVERHLGEVYSRAAEHWGLAERANRTQVIALLQYYYSTQLGEIPHA